MCEMDTREFIRRREAVDKGNYALLNRHGAGRHAEKSVPSGLGLLVTALDNYTSRPGKGGDEKNGVCYGNLSQHGVVIALSGWLTRGDGYSRLLSKDKLKTRFLKELKEKLEKELKKKHLEEEEFKKELEKELEKKAGDFDGLTLEELKSLDRKVTQTYHTGINNFVSNALSVARELESIDTVPAADDAYEKGHKEDVMDVSVVKDMYESLETILYKRIKDDQRPNHSKPYAPLYTRLAEHPITGDDEFSKAMYYVYERDYPRAKDDSECNGLDLRKVIWAIQARYAPFDETMATIESLRAFLLGVLFGPEGLAIYCGETDTYEPLSPYDRVWTGFTLAQLRAFSDAWCEDAVVPFTMDDNCVTIGSAGDFCPKTVTGESISELANHCLRIDRHEDDDGIVFWSVSACEKSKMSCAICRAVDDQVVVLGQDCDAVRLTDGDELWLGVDVTAQVIRPNYESGAAIRFNVTSTYEYEDVWMNDENASGAKKSSSAEAVATGASVATKTGLVIGFSIDDLDWGNHADVYYADIADKNKRFAYTIGRSGESGFQCGLVEYSGVGRLHATFIPDGAGGVLFHDGEMNVRPSTRGSNIFRNGLTISVGKAAHGPEEILLADNDLLLLPSMETPNARLRFHYLYA